MLEVFKVVVNYNSADGKRESCAADGKFLVHYKPNEWTNPPIGYFFAFATYKAAVIYANHYSYNTEVWRCETEEIVQPPVHVADPAWAELIEKFWSGKSMNQIEWIKTPADTIWCKPVKLVERVWKNVGVKV